MIDNWPTIGLKIMKPRRWSNTHQGLSNGMKVAPRISLDLICEHQLNFQSWKYSNFNNSCIACLNMTKSSLWFEVSCMDTKHKKPLCEQKDTWTNIRLNKQPSKKHDIWTWLHFQLEESSFVKNKIQWIILLSSFVLFSKQLKQAPLQSKEYSNTNFLCNPFVFHTPNSHKMRYSQILTKFWPLTAISQNHRTKFEP